MRPLSPADRIIAGLLHLFIGPSRLLRSAIVLRPATLLHLHNVLRKQKYDVMLFSIPPSARVGQARRDRKKNSSMSSWQRNDVIPTGAVLALPSNRKHGNLGAQSVDEFLAGIRKLNETKARTE